MILMCYSLHRQYVFHGQTRSDTNQPILLPWRQYTLHRATDFVLEVPAVK